MQVRICDGIQGNINAARIQAFEAAECEYIGFADPDDRVLPGALDACVQAISAGARAVCTLEQYINEAGLVLSSQDRHGPAWQHPGNVHHLLIVHRSIYRCVLPLIRDLPNGIEWALAIAAEKHGLVKLAVVGYQWRLHGANSYWHDRTLRSFGKKVAEALV